MFHSGVIEGFYGRPWSAGQRAEMLDWIKAAGMNVFAYAPKDDIKIRARWRELYDATEAENLAALAKAANARGITLMGAVSPCLDIRHSDAREIAALNRKIGQLDELGMRFFVLLFDDVPSILAPDDRKVFSSFAAAQAHVANAVHDFVKGLGGDRKLFFCPTEYCGRMAGGDVRKSAYLQEIGAKLNPGIEIFWTGPEIVSAEITAQSLREVGAVLRRKPVIWENFHANDYDIRRAHLGPLGGRKSDILPEIAGFITNPNNEFEANYPAVHTLGLFLSGAAYNEADALESACCAWQRRFQYASSEPPRFLDQGQVELLADLLYQPFRLGPRSQAVVTMARYLLAEAHACGTHDWQNGVETIRAFLKQVSRLFDDLTEIANRDLFYTVQPYLWECREELQTLTHYLDWLATKPASEATFPHHDRLPNTYRRGFTAALQQLLPRDSNGRYHHEP
jgi:hypothetical protein